MANSELSLDSKFQQKLANRTATQRDFTAEANRLRWERLQKSIEALASL